jgi:hypothetical protein
VRLPRYRTFATATIASFYTLQPGVISVMDLPPGGAQPSAAVITGEVPLEIGPIELDTDALELVPQLDDSRTRIALDLRVADDARPGYKRGEARFSLTGEGRTVPVTIRVFARVAEPDAEGGAAPAAAPAQAGSP